MDNFRYKIKFKIDNRKLWTWFDLIFSENSVFDQILWFKDFKEHMLSTEALVTSLYEDLESQEVRQWNEHWMD